MKILFALLLLTFGALAETETPVGIYQLDHIHSRMVGFEKSVALRGHIEMAKDFNESKISVEGKNFSFESTEFIGTIENFTVRGMLTMDGVSSNVSLKGQYVGMINNELKNRAAFNLSNKNFHLKFYGSRPTESTTALLKEVQSIVQ